MNIQSVSTMNYHDLQDTLDKVIGKIGLASTIRLLQKVVQERHVQANKDEKIKLITSYLILRCQAVFELKEDKFFSSTMREYKDGRMACFSLLRKYTDGSYANIADQFGQSKRNILYHCHKCEEILSVPQFYKIFTEKYKLLENHMLEFLAKLNNENENEAPDTQ